MIGYLRQDDDFHWYLIPEDKIIDFDDLIIDIQINQTWGTNWYLLVEEFNNNYRGYRLKGCLEDLRVIIDENI